MPDRFAHVSHNIYRGGEPSEDDIDVLKDSWNIQKIVSLDEEAGNKIDDYCKKLGIEHVIIPLTNGNDKNFKLIPDELKTWGNDYIYVHCLYGRDRTSAVIAMYRLLIDDWTLKEALEEAKAFKMGDGVDEQGKRLYFGVVKNFSTSLQKDKAFSDDIVTMERDTQNYTNPAPAANNYHDIAFSQQSFAPFADGDIRSNIFSSRNIILKKIASAPTRIDILRKIAEPPLNVYKYCKLSDVLQNNQIWYATVTEAYKHSNEPKCFTASISTNAKVRQFSQEPESTLIEQATLEGAEVIIFNNQFVIINPTILDNIHSVGSDENNNDIPLVGQFEDYKGSTLYPDNGSIPGGAGGVTGLIKLPGAIPYTEV